MDPDPMSWRILTWLTLWGIWKEGNIGCTSPQGRRSHGVHRDFGSNKLWLVSRGCLSFAVLHKTSLIVVHMIEICLQQQNKLTWSHRKSMLCRSSALSLNTNPCCRYACVSSYFQNLQRRQCALLGGLWAIRLGLPAMSVECGGQRLS